jgi:hypothetical protein
VRIDEEDEATKWPAQIVFCVLAPTEAEVLQFATVGEQPAGRPPNVPGSDGGAAEGVAA